MNENELKLQYPYGQFVPEPATCHELAPGIKWIRMPLPFALNHINLWLLADELDDRKGWTIVDCGIARDEVKALWQDIFDKALDNLPVLRVLVTHMHPDHVGLAHWICERWQAPLLMSMTDYAIACAWSGSKGTGAGTGGDLAVKHFASHGLVDLEAQEQIRQRASYYPSLVPAMPRSFTRLLNDAVINIGDLSWRCIVGYGHAPEHIALYNEQHKVLISGDMVLPRISTNISVFDYEPMANPLPLYLRSLRSYESLPKDTLILPSHGLPFIGLHERLRQLHEHHKERLAELLDMCANPLSAAQVVPIMFKRQLDLHQLTFAMGEALAHLHALYFEGKLSRSLGNDGIYRFQKV